MSELDIRSSWEVKRGYVWPLDSAPPAPPAVLLRPPPEPRVLHPKPSPSSALAEARLELRRRIALRREARR